MGKQDATSVRQLPAPDALDSRHHDRRAGHAHTSCCTQQHPATVGATRTPTVLRRDDDEPGALVTRGQVSVQKCLEIARCGWQVQPLFDLQDQFVCANSVVATTDHDQPLDALQVRCNLGRMGAEGEALLEMAAQCVAIDRLVGDQTRDHGTRHHRRQVPNRVAPTRVLRGRHGNKVGGLNGLSGSQGPQGPSGFGDLVRQTVNKVNENQMNASKISSAYERGEGVPLTDVVLSMQKSSIAFEATLQVRNKVLKAYEDILNMPV